MEKTEDFICSRLQAQLGANKELYPPETRLIGGQSRTIGASDDVQRQAPWPLVLCASFALRATQCCRHKGDERTTTALKRTKEQPGWSCTAKCHQRDVGARYRARQRTSETTLRSWGVKSTDSHALCDEGIREREKEGCPTRSKSKPLARSLAPFTHRYLSQKPSRTLIPKRQPNPSLSRLSPPHQSGISIPLNTSSLAFLAAVAFSLSFPTPSKSALTSFLRSAFVFVLRVLRILAPPLDGGGTR